MPTARWCLVAKKKAKASSSSIFFADKIEMVEISKLKPWPKNPRNNDMAIKPVAESIRQYGMIVPILINKKNEIIAGNTRYLACKDELKLDKIPCVRGEHLTKDQQEMFNIADNKLGEIATWDHDMLKDILSNIQGRYEGTFDPTIVGFQQAEIDLMMGGWQSSAQRVNDVKSDDSVAPGKIVIECLSEEEEELRVKLQGWIDKGDWDATIK